MNKPLTAEEAKNLTFPCLLEVWDRNRDGNRGPVITVVMSLNNESQYVDTNNCTWYKAALPSPEITEAMRKQFAPASEYPKRMLVWDYDESQAEPRIVLSDLGEKASSRYIVVRSDCESKYENGEGFSCTDYNHAKPLPEPDPIAQEIAELRQRLAELEAKHNQLTK